MNSATLTQVIASNQEMKLLVKNYVMGRTNLNRKNILSFSSEIASEFGKYNRHSQKYELYVDELPDFIQHEFASMIISQDDAYANESTGADNPKFTSQMLPSLLNHLKDISNKDLEMDFINIWRNGVTSYLLNEIQRYLDDSVSDLNRERLY